MDVSEAGQAHGLHLGRGVELHGARPQRDHAPVECEVLVGQPTQVAQHRGLGVVLREDRMAQYRAPAEKPFGQCGLGARCPGDRPEGFQDGGAVGRRGRLAARDPDVVLVDEPQEHPAPTGLRHDHRRPPARLDDHRVEELPVLQAEAGALQSAGQVDGALVDPPSNPAQSLGAVVHGIHGRNDRQQHLGGADVGGRLLAADVLLARLQGEAVGRTVLGVDREPDETTW